MSEELRKLTASILDKLAVEAGESAQVVLARAVFLFANAEQLDIELPEMLDLGRVLQEEQDDIPDRQAFRSAFVTDKQLPISKAKEQRAQQLLEIMEVGVPYYINTLAKAFGANRTSITEWLQYLHSIGHVERVKGPRAAWAWIHVTPDINIDFLAVERALHQNNKRPYIKKSTLKQHKQVLEFMQPGKLYQTAECAQALNIKRASAEYLLKRMVKLGLLKMQKGAEHNRNEYSLTEQV